MLVVCSRSSNFLLLGDYPFPFMKLLMEKEKLKEHVKTIVRAYDFDLMGVDLGSEWGNLWFPRFISL